MREDLLNNDLFGNQAGEDEDKERLNDYYLEKEQNARFFDKGTKLSFVRARKGVGKSALLNYTAYKVEEKYPEDIIINIKASELFSLIECDEKNYLLNINCWQQRICSRVLNEIAKMINFACDDDSMRIVEHSEITGFKGKDILTALIDRLKIKGSVVEKNQTDESVFNSYEVLKRFSSKQNKCVWLFIDDIDATFKNVEDNKIIVGSFFTACRYLTNDVNGLNIRASVRTDVWTILKNFDESLDKCEQYMLDLSWSTRDTGEILYNKIYSYFKHKDKNIGEKNYSDTEEQKRIFNYLFTKYLLWGGNKVNPYRVIHILSAGRPRWAAQLCKLAALDAYNKGKDKIASGNINFAMNEYGKYRMADLLKEHSHQCDKIESITGIFRNGERKYRTNSLLYLVDSKIIKQGIDIYIDGDNQPCDEKQICKFLYRIGFITLRTDEYNKALGLTRFEDDPYMFSESNIDDSQIWEIHPAYRTVLQIK